MSDRANPVVAIGASAGGLEALEHFFSGMPAQPGLSCVILTHLAPNRDSHLAEILARYTDMTVVTAEDGAELGVDHVHVLPAGHAMGIRNGRLSVTPHPGPERLHHPIDLFFGELAQDQGENAVGIVLSGTGTDGTLGLRAIKEAGGLTLAQGGAGSAPAYESMPGSAIGAGVDLVLPAQAMAMRIIEIVKSSPTAVQVNPETLTRQHLIEIHALLRQSSGHDFSGYKSNTFARRVARRMLITQLDRPDAYLERLRTDEKERHSLFLGLLISVTGFFRDPDAFEAVEAALPALTSAKAAADDEIRVWVPGCATGEEVYSIAMLLREHLDRSGEQRTVRIFATDINEAALTVARSGTYPAALVEPISAERLQRFFEKTPAGFKVVKAVRDMCVFSSHSVTKDPPFSRINLISCRNLLIYISAAMQDRLIPVFHFALRPGGCLFLGTSENISRHQHLFLPLDKKQRLFQRREHGSGHRPPPLDYSGASRTTRSDQAGGIRSERLGLRRLTELRMLERYTPAHVVVNREGQVLHYSSKTGKYLEAPSGAPSRELFSLVRTSLRLELRSAFEQARAGQLPVLRERIELEREDGLQPLDLIIERLPDNDTDPLYLVIFRDRGPTVTHEEARALAADETTEQERLRHELAEARERLQVVMEEYDTSLEEIKSSNEELISLNEELQSANQEHEVAKEELQSVNEELNTVNTELHENLQELDRANTDLRNLFDSTHIAIIFLDRALRIRSFTPAIRDIFNLLRTDQGRPLLDIASSIPLDTLREDLEAVLHTGEPSESRVGSADGRAHYLVRVQPYLHSDGTIDGVTVAFIDVTALAEFEGHQETLIEELNHRVRNMLTVVVVLARQTIRGHKQPEDFRRAFIPRVEAMAKTYQLVSREGWKTVSLAELIAESVAALCPEPDCFDLDGPPLLVTPKAALALGLVLAELATNAVKYGALRRPEGRVAVTWRLHRAGERTWLVLRWQEKGGPPVAPPRTESFGSMLIRREISHDLGGRAALRFAPDGLQALFKMPFEATLFRPGEKGRG